MRSNGDNRANSAVRLILASGSPYRRELLTRLGVPFESVAAAIDERRLPDESPRDLVTRLAREKAAAVAGEHPHAFVIGSDQVAAIDDEVLNKPQTTDAACAQLARLSGRTHELLTAVCVLHGHQQAAALDVHEMRMRSLVEAEIRDYVAEDAPLDCAGAYRIEAAGIRLFTSLRGDDYTGIVGLPLTVVRRLLDELEFPWDDR